MPLPLDPVPPPLTVWPDGSVRVGGSRVLFAALIELYLAGHSAAALVENFDVLSPADVYACIAYYHRYRPRVEEFLKEYDAAGETIRARFAASQQGLPDIRARILAARTGEPATV